MQEERRRYPRIGPAKVWADTVRHECEQRMDEALDDTFPASDVPAYGCLAERIKRLANEE